MVQGIRNDGIICSKQGLEYTAIGTITERHDLSGLNEPLRSHGGLSEQRVPLLFSATVNDDTAARSLRNFDIFDIALNHLTGQTERATS